MSVRPKDLKTDRAIWCVLHCGECIIDYSASSVHYEWMFETDPIVCEACGEELVLEEKTLTEA